MQESALCLPVYSVHLCQQYSLCVRCVADCCSSLASAHAASSFYLPLDISPVLPKAILCCRAREAAPLDPIILHNQALLRRFKEAAQEPALDDLTAGTLLLSSVLCPGLLCIFGGRLRLPANALQADLTEALRRIAAVCCDAWCNTEL